MLQTLICLNSSAIDLILDFDNQFKDDAWVTENGDNICIWMIRIHCYIDKL